MKLCAFTVWHQFNESVHFNIVAERSWRIVAGKGRERVSLSSLIINLVVKGMKTKAQVGKLVVVKWLKTWCNALQFYIMIITNSLFMGFILLTQGNSTRKNNSAASDAEILYDSCLYISAAPKINIPWNWVSTLREFTQQNRLITAIFPTT